MDFMNKFVDTKTVIEGLVLALVLWLAKVIWERLHLRRDGKAIIEWLRRNTRDESLESHRTSPRLRAILD